MSSSAIFKILFIVLILNLTFLFSTLFLDSKSVISPTFDVGQPGLIGSHTNIWSNSYDNVNSYVVAKNYAEEGFFKHGGLANRKGNPAAGGFFDNTKCLPKVDSKTDVVIKYRSKDIDRSVTGFFNECLYFGYYPYFEMGLGLLYKVGIDSIAEQKLIFFALNCLGLLLAYAFLRMAHSPLVSVATILSFTTSMWFYSHYDQSNFNFAHFIFIWPVLFALKRSGIEDNFRNQILFYIAVITLSMFSTEYVFVVLLLALFGNGFGLRTKIIGVFLAITPLIFQLIGLYFVYGTEFAGLFLNKISDRTALVEPYLNLTIVLSNLFEYVFDNFGLMISGLLFFPFFHTTEKKYFTLVLLGIVFFLALFWETTTRHTFILYNLFIPAIVVGVAVIFSRLENFSREVLFAFFIGVLIYNLFSSNTIHRNLWQQASSNFPYKMNAKFINYLSWSEDCHSPWSTVRGDISSSSFLQFDRTYRTNDGPRSDLKYSVNCQNYIVDSYFREPIQPKSLYALIKKNLLPKSESCSVFKFEAPAASFVKVSTRPEVIEDSKIQNLSLEYKLVKWPLLEQSGRIFRFQCDFGEPQDIRQIDEISIN